MRFLIMRVLLAALIIAPAALIISAPFVVNSALESNVYDEVTATAVMDSMTYDGNQVVPVAWQYAGNDFTATVRGQLSEGMPYTMPVNELGFQASTMRDNFGIWLFIAVVSGIAASVLTLLVVSIFGGWDGIARREYDYKRAQERKHLRAA